MKKLIAILVCLLIMGVCASAIGETDTWLNDWTYQIDDTDLPGYIKLTKYTGKSNDITVPGTAVVDGVSHKVEIPAAQNSGSSIFPVSIFPTSTTSIMLDGVTLAPNSFKAFFKLNNLTTITFNSVDTSHVTNASYMFSNCTSLQAINLKGLDFSNVTDISDMFSFCRTLKEIDLSVLNLSNVTDMMSLFGSCSSLEKISINGSQLGKVTNLGAVFSFDSALKVLDLSDWNVQNVTDMSSMFQDCINLTTINLTGWNTAKVVNMNSMFSNCTSLKELDLTSFDMSSLTRMDHFFEENISLEKIALGSRFKFVYLEDTKSSVTFPYTEGMGWKSQKTGMTYTALKILTDRNGIADTYTKTTLTDDTETSEPPTTGTFLTTDIGVYRLENKEATFNEPIDKNMETLTIPATVISEGTTYKVTAIQEGALKGMKKLTKVTIGKNVTSIGANAFASCTKLKTVTFGSNLTTIGESAFKGCKALLEVTIPAKVSKIGRGAFQNCSKLKKINIKTSKLTTSNVGANAFKGIAKKATVKVPSKSLKTYKKWLTKKGLPKTATIKK